MKLFDWLQDISSPEVPDPENPEDPLSPALKARLTELKKMPVTEAMIPRSVVTALDVDVQLRRVRRLKSSKTIYFPVYKGDLDHILGWIPKQKVLELLNEPSEDVQLAQHLRPVGEIPDSHTVADLADAFLKSASPFLVVKNSQGATAGIVALADFVELVFGFEMGTPTHNSPSEYSAPLLRSYEL